FKNHTTAIQLQNNFVSDWREQVRQGAAYACENSRNLIIDVRSNFGGRGDLVQWLNRYFQPDNAGPADVNLVLRELSQEPTAVELRTLATLAQDLGITPPSCVTGFERQCFVDVPGLNPLTSPNWFSDPIVSERRGRQVESMTRLLAFPDGDVPANEVIPCPGKFEGRRLIVLANGLNASAGFFGAEPLRNVGTIVTTGGIFHRLIATGRARGGATTSSLFPRFVQDFLTGVTGVPASNPLPVFNRDIRFNYEFYGLYEGNLKDLYVEGDLLGDLHVNVWSNSRDTDGFVYGKVLRGVRLIR
ncbi:MAG: hypothetical protein AAF449_23470, partial [Myxococcota bacterium]